MLHDARLGSLDRPILIVEDHPINALVLRSMLGKHGHASLVAANGWEGVEMSRLHRPRLVMMDLQMPQMDGYSAAADIRRQAGDAAPPIVAVTASVASRVRGACLDAGFADLIVKPIMMDELMAVVRRLLPNG